MEKLRILPERLLIQLGTRPAVALVKMGLMNQKNSTAAKANNLSQPSCVVLEDMYLVHGLYSMNTVVRLSIYIAC
jgi:hypothetical protein